jgi:hypothetical protein
LPVADGKKAEFVNYIPPKGTVFSEYDVFLLLQVIEGEKLS